ncbi:MAG: HD domain-containing protein [Bacteroidales bacterium]|nr:HD domain-containing protein [Bacteroidales bacterium]
MTNLATGFLGHPVFSLVSHVAADMGVRAFVIGGYVRDCFLGRSNDDIDIVVEGSGIALAEAVADYVRKHEKAYCKVSVFRNFGTAMLKYKGTEIEFVGARKESYERNSRKPIVEDGTLEDDQKRRDFTINAMAFSLQKDDFGALVDPFGGIRDLDAGIIRTPLDPEVTYCDDPLRMLRAIRFVAKLSTPERQFSIVPESIEAMRRMKDRMTILSKERIAEELNKILVTPKPSIGFRLLDETGLLDYILPQLSKLKGVETIDGRGHKDIFSHTIQVVDNVAELDSEPNLWLRWAALLHDIGKPQSKRWDPAVGWTFHGHEVIGARMVPKIFDSLRMPLNEKMKYVQKLVGLHHRPIALVDEEVTDSAVRRLLFDAGDEIDDLMTLCSADITSKNPVKVAKIRKNFELVSRKLVEVEAKDAIRNWKNPITGEYVMEVYGIGPCNIIGMIKERVKNAVLDGVIENNFEAADKFMREIAPEYGLVAVK